MRNAASVSQLLHESSLPRGARIVRVVSMRVGAFMRPACGIGKETIIDRDERIVSACRAEYRAPKRSILASKVAIARQSLPTGVVCEIPS